MIETSLQHIADAVDERAAEARQEATHEHDFTTHTGNTLDSIENSLAGEAIFSFASWNLFFTELHQTATAEAMSGIEEEYEAEPPAALAAGTDYRQVELPPLFGSVGAEEAA